MEPLSVMHGLLQDSNRLWRFVRNWDRNTDMFFPRQTAPRFRSGASGKRDTFTDIRFAYVMCFVSHCIQLLSIDDRRYWHFLKQGYTHEKARFKAYGDREEKTDIARRLMVTMRKVWDDN